MTAPSPRLAVRAILIHEDRLLMVNAYADERYGLMCAPGGGVEIGTSLPDNLKREMFEETGLKVTVGDPCLVNEFHDPSGDFHQVDVYFRCTLEGPATINPNWRDTDKIVVKRSWLTKAELTHTPHKPDSLVQVAFDPSNSITYDPLEPIVR